MSGTDLPKISDETMNAFLRAAHEAGAGAYISGGEGRLEVNDDHVRAGLAVALVASGWRPPQEINEDAVELLARRAWRRRHSITWESGLDIERQEFLTVARLDLAALVASGYRREVDVLREAADRIDPGPASTRRPALNDLDDMQMTCDRGVATRLRTWANVRDRDRATALEPAQPLLAADLCGEVGTGFPNGSYADPTYTEPCALPFDHEEDHDRAQREALEAAEGQERSEEPR